jgi:hypothetical protein
MSGENMGQNLDAVKKKLHTNPLIKIRRLHIL